MRTLKVTSGPTAGETRQIDAEIVIGREAADLVVPDDEASRRHAAVRPVGAGIEVEDFGSLNGTFVDGQRLQGSVTLTASSALRIGSTQLAIEISLPAADAAPPPDVTAPRRVRQSPDVTAPRRVPPAPDVTAPRRVPPAPDVTAPRRVPPAPDVTAPRQVIQGEEGERDRGSDRTVARSSPRSPAPPGGVASPADLTAPHDSPRSPAAPASPGAAPAERQREIRQLLKFVAAGLLLAVTIALIVAILLA